MKCIGIYIHIPFCIKKCIYCDFISYANKKEMQKRYMQALIKEIKKWKEKNKNTIIDTIYIGGGTPSSIDSKYIVQILEVLDIKKIENCEITIEVNPGTITTQKLQDYKKAGINRLSIGLQAVQNNLLKMLGRIHDFDDFLNTYNKAREIGFENINIDLMIGLPTQTIQDIKETLETIVNLEPKHISIYSLIVEENTIIEKKIKQGILKLPNEELERNMYWYVKNFLELKEYKHYEISNFAKIGYESKHNMNCWNQKEYIGFGLAAHSYIDKIRFSNETDLEKYIENIEKNKFNENINIEEKQTKYQEEQEFMLLGLRKIQGVSIQKFKNKFTDNPIFLFKEQLDKLNSNGLIIINQDNIQLTKKGLDLANLVWEEFV